MKEKLTNNLSLKLLSIFLAFFVWIVVMNVSNPEVTRMRDVQIEILNEDILLSADKTYEIQGKSTVSVSYVVRTRDEYRIKSSDFRAYVDLADLYDVTGSVPITVEVLNNKDYIIGTPTARPAVLRITTEDVQRKKFDLQVTTKGEPEAGYTVGTTEVSPDYVYVTGPVSVIGQINHVGIEIDVEAANTSISGDTTPVFYDANGNRLTVEENVTLNQQTIGYLTPIQKLKTLGLDLQVEGEVAGGYRYTGVQSDVQGISVVGSTSAMQGLSTVTIPGQELNITGAAADKVVTVDVTKYLPAGVAVNGSSKITVTMKVEALVSKTLTLTTSDLIRVGASEQLDYSYDTKELKVVVQGLAADLDKLTVDDLNATINLSNLTIGSHQGQPEFTPGDEFTVLSFSEFNILVSNKMHGPAGGGETPPSMPAETSVPPSEENTSAEHAADKTPDKTPEKTTEAAPEHTTEAEISTASSEAAS